MLLKIREVTAGKFSYFIVAVISVPFALWGVNYYFQGGFDPVVIEVGSGEVSLSQFDASFNQKKRDLEASLDPSQMPTDQVIRSEVVGDFIRSEILRQEADEYRYHVTDVELAQAVVGVPSFQTDGKFDRELYLNLLKVQGQSQASFETGLKEQLRRGRLYRVIDDSGFVLPDEKAAYRKLLYQERHVRYIEFPTARYVHRDSVNSTEIRTYYEENQGQFMTPDKFRLRYVEFKADDIAAGLTVEEDDLRAYYDDNPDLFIVPEQRTLAHILIDPDRRGEDESDKLAQEIHQRLRRGEDFAELARSYSDDSLTAEQGGELPPLVREDLDDDVEEAVFALETGQFSEPLKTPFGLQIFKLIAVGSSGAQTFEDAHDAIEDQIRRGRAENIYSESLAEAEIIAYEYPQNMLQLVQAVPMLDEVKSTDWLDVSKHEGLFQYPAVRKAVYTDKLLQDRINSEVLEVGPGHAFIVRIDEDGYEPSRQRAYEEVESEITEQLVQGNARVEASGAVDNAIGRIESKKMTFEELAGKESLPVHDLGFIRRGADQPPPTVAYGAFLIPETGLRYRKVEMENAEGYAIVELVATREGEAPSEETQELSFTIHEYNAVLLGILQKNPVKIHADRFGNDTSQ